MSALYLGIVLVVIPALATLGGIRFHGSRVALTVAFSGWLVARLVRAYGGRETPEGQVNPVFGSWIR
jgi:hypothetical protein